MSRIEDMNMSKQLPSTARRRSAGRNKSDNNHGCAFWLLVFIIICVAIVIYSVVWIPAIGFLIFFAVRRDYNGTKKRNIIISAVVMVTSFIVFLLIGSPPELSSIHADWGKKEFDISETTEVRITGYPDGAEIESLELSENNIAELNYTDGKAVIKFTGTGEAALFFTANGDIDSSTTTITVVDKEAEEQVRKEAEEKAEQERIAQEQAEKEAQEQAEREAQEQAEIEAQEQAQQSQVSENSDSQEQMVWIPQSGSKYHSDPSCSGMDNPRQVTISEAQGMGYEPCKKCY